MYCYINQQSQIDINKVMTSQRNKLLIFFANWFLYYLFYVQPGVNRVDLLLSISKWFSSYHVMYVVISVILLNGTWLFAHLYMYMYYYLQIPFFEQFRTQPIWNWLHPVNDKKQESVTLNTQAVSKAIVSQIFSILINAVLVYSVLHQKTEEELYQHLLQTPNWYSSTIKLLIGIFMFETIFYWAHRLQHEIKGLYEDHKVHHQFKQPNAITGSWGGSYDGLVSIILPGAIPVFLLNFHIYEFWMWAVIHVFHTVYDHCGYEFPVCILQLIPFSGYAAAHNFHHSHIMGNFGLYYQFWDHIMQTNKAWLEFQSLTREQQQKQLATRQQLPVNFDLASLPGDRTAQQAS